MIKSCQNFITKLVYTKGQKGKENSKKMNEPQIVVNHLQVNIRAPQELHVVSHSSVKKSKTISEHQIQPIPQAQEQQIMKNPHKIRHIESIDDKGEFIDENRQSRVSDKDELNETINRVNYPEMELPIDEQSLEKIVEEGQVEETDTRQLKHLSIQKDKDEFNSIGMSREKQNKKKRRLSESNLSSYAEVRSQFSLGEYLSQQEKRIPQRIQKIMEEELEGEKKEKGYNSPARRDRKKSVHSVHRGSSPSVSEEFRRMIVDELDKKKKTLRKEQQMEEQNNEILMEEIKQEKQEDDVVNMYGLEHAREKMEKEISVLSKVFGQQIEPELSGNSVMEKKSTIQEEDAMEEIYET